MQPSALGVVERAVLKELRYREVRLIGVGDGIDTAQEGSSMLYGMRAILNETYLDDLRKKTHRGLMGRAHKGLCTGGVTYGYRNVEVKAGSPDAGKSMVVDPDESLVVMRIFEEYAAGKSVRACRYPKPFPPCFSKPFPPAPRVIGVVSITS